ncbi:5-methyltetrahydropteroyltriglutamate--homocysteine S-methyltransferase, partial [bacterium]|nr:5-methyltetrahydropteroyltriglutamate--homocysteine S-methyltransferase [bacterium]
MKTSVYGFPKMGPNRELKKTMEKYWSGEITGSDLRSEYNTVNRMRLETCKNAGIDIISSGDFSGYDFMLDLSIMFGVIPDRFKNIADPLKLYYAMARGTDDAIACEMTKWFDTNYHYIVPELTGTFSLAKNAQEDAYTFAKSILGNNPNPVFVGPFTYISLSKIIGNETVKADESPQFESLVKSLAKVYNQLLKNLEKAGVTHIQLDEPSLVLEQS